MNAATKTKPASTYTSGFCGLRLPDSSHRRCPQVVGATTCTCPCHHRCQACGQQLPTNRQETP